jgi:hypothetical protein
MGIDDLRERIERLLGGDRHQAGAYHDALLDLKVGIKDLTDALAITGRELEAERGQLATVERRGKLARDIGDQETVQIALTYAEKHRQRVSVLERKLGVQQDELALAQREYEELAEKYRALKQGMPLNHDPVPPPAAEAEDPLLRARLERQATEKAVDAQLELLKKKLGRQ